MLLNTVITYRQTCMYWPKSLAGWTVSQQRIINSKAGSTVNVAACYFAAACFIWPTSLHETNGSSQMSCDLAWQWMLLW